MKKLEENWAKHEKQMSLRLAIMPRNPIITARTVIIKQNCYIHLWKVYWSAVVLENSICKQFGQINTPAKRETEENSFLSKKARQWQQKFCWLLYFPSYSASILRRLNATLFIIKNIIIFLNMTKSLPKLKAPICCRFLTFSCRCRNFMVATLSFVPISFRLAVSTPCLP